MKNFGLIGYPLTHSFSQKYFTEKFKREGITDCRYDLFPLEEIDEIRLLLVVERDLRGLNVTIPYKEKVIPYLDELDLHASRIGAVNCIKISKEESPGLYGYNTDHEAFRETLRPILKSHHNKALVFGTGGASRAVGYALHALGIEYRIVSRSTSAENLSYAVLDKNVLDAFPVLINCTPVGTYPHTGEMLPLPLQFLTPGHLVYDLIYNPSETNLLRIAREHGAIVKNGLEMLEMQAELSWKIWNM